MQIKRNVLCFLVLLAGAALSGYALSGLEKQKPDLNVLLITLDTIRPDRISCYSTEHLQTPHIDRLAKRGIVFERAFAHNPTTLPSHTNILLGTTPLQHGVHENSLFKVADDSLTLAEYLKARGYSTGAFIGAFPLDSRFGLSQGFDEYDDSYPSRSPYAFFQPERKAEKVIEASLAWLHKQASPWFAWVHIWDPHVPYMPPEPYLEKFKDDPYSGEVAYVDAELGRLFDYLQSSGSMENTLVILTGDHGESLGDHGELTHSYFAYNSTLWVPLIIAGPGIAPSRTGEYVSHIDIFPTICDILGMEKPRILQGVSLLPLMKGKKIEKKPIYFESLDPYYNRGCAPLRGFIKEKRKFIDSPLPEFYNLENDFDEEINLVRTIPQEDFRNELEKIEKELSSGQKEQQAQKADKEALEILRSLGYISSPFPQLKETYGPEHDVKTSLPFQQKFARAIILNEEGRREESVKLLNEIIQERKDFDLAYFYLHQIYKVQGDTEKALKVIREGYQNNSGNYNIVSALGIFFVQEEMWDEGIKVLREALELINFDPEAWNYLGVAFWKKGDDQKALECYQKALSLDDSYALAFSNLGALYLSLSFKTQEKRSLSQAMEYFKKAIELDPDLGLAYRGLGVSYKASGRIDAAITVWERALTLSPDDDFLLFNLGKAYFEKGSKIQALPYFEKYLLLKKDAISPEERTAVETLIRECKQNPAESFRE